MSEKINESAEYQSIVLNKRQQCDLELLMNGGFTPLDGFLNEGDYNSVVEKMRLLSGEVWPMPIVLPVKEEKRSSLNLNETITLKNEENLPLAMMKLESIFKPDLVKECVNVYGSDDDNHPYVKIVMENKGGYYLGGKVTKIQLPPHFDFSEDRLTPEETRNFIREKGWERVVGFQTRNPMHRSHFELTKYAMDQGDANLLLHPVVGITQDCDVDYFTRVKCYKKLMKYYPENSAKLCLLPLSMRMAGPREAVWHAIIRKNYGCTHFVVGRDHAGPSYKKKDGSDFYGPYDAQELLESVADEIGIKLITSKLIVYAKSKETGEGIYSAIDNVDKEKYEIMNISGTKQRELLRNGEKLPEWFTFPEIEEELVKEFKPKSEQGFCLYFVGLSGCGKTTLANAMKAKLQEKVSGRQITILDGDIVRQHLSRGLGFSKEDRSVNIQRIGYVASEIVKHNGIVLCANIAPFENDRKVNRDLISQYGGYIEVYVDTTLDECEKRDVKGLYKLAREGKIKQFTGISDPFEEPVNCSIKLDGGSNIPLEENINKIVNYLQNENYL